MLQPVDAKIKVEGQKENFGQVSIEPLPRGYGHTLGNALRRVLLSSLPGAALTQVTFAGVPHKFTTIPGVREDVLEITLRLKEVRLKINSNSPAILHLSATGPGKLTAGDIQTPPEVEILNKDLVLATLADRETKIEAELVAEPGTGYSPVEERSKSKVGVLLLDAIFTPVIKAAYRVEAARVGQVTDLDKLILEVTTDGTFSPKEAVMKAAEILASFFGRVAGGQEEIGQPKEESQKPKISEEMLATLLEELDLPTRVVNALKKARIKTVGELLAREEKDLLKVKNLGEKSLAEITRVLTKEGFR